MKDVPASLDKTPTFFPLQDGGIIKSAPHPHPSMSKFGHDHQKIKIKNPGSPRFPRHNSHDRCSRPRTQRGPLSFSGWWARVSIFFFFLFFFFLFFLIFLLFSFSVFLSFSLLVFSLVSF